MKIKKIHFVVYIFLVIAFIYILFLFACSIINSADLSFLEGIDAGIDTNTCNITSMNEINCNDNIDDDCDKKIDCEDEDCLTQYWCCDKRKVDGSENKNVDYCHDNCDNDSDQLIDCEDSDCRTVTYKCVPPETNCNDSIDNDGDRLIDDEDSDCQNANETNCNDEIDNDLDSFVDCVDEDCIDSDPNCCPAKVEEAIKDDFCLNDDCTNSGYDSLQWTDFDNGPTFEFTNGYITKWSPDTDNIFNGIISKNTIDLSFGININLKIKLTPDDSTEIPSQLDGGVANDGGVNNLYCGDGIVNGCNQLAGISLLHKVLSEAPDEISNDAISIWATDYEQLIIMDEGVVVQKIGIPRRWDESLQKYTADYDINLSLIPAIDSNNNVGWKLRVEVPGGTEVCGRYGISRGCVSPNVCGDQGCYIWSSENVIINRSENFSFDSNESKQSGVYIGLLGRGDKVQSGGIETDIFGCVNPSSWNYSRFKNSSAINGGDIITANDINFPIQGKTLAAIGSPHVFKNDQNYYIVFDIINQPPIKSGYGINNWFLDYLKSTNIDNEDYHITWIDKNGIEFIDVLNDPNCYSEDDWSPNIYTQECNQNTSHRTPFIYDFNIRKVFYASSDLLSAYNYKIFLRSFDVDSNGLIKGFYNYSEGQGYREVAIDIENYKTYIEPFYIKTDIFNSNSEYIQDWLFFSGTDNAGKQNIARIGLNSEFAPIEDKLYTVFSYDDPALNNLSESGLSSPSLIEDSDNGLLIWFVAYDKNLISSVMFARFGQPFSSNNSTGPYNDNDAGVDSQGDIENSDINIDEDDNTWYLWPGNPVISQEDLYNNGICNRISDNQCKINSMTTAIITHGKTDNNEDIRILHIWLGIEKDSNPQYEIIHLTQPWGNL